MPRTRSGEQISVRVPAFAKDRLGNLPAELQAATGENAPSQPEIVAALVATVKTRTLSQALRAYRRELGKHGVAEFHR
jgi:hypothetical protein